MPHQVTVNVLPPGTDWAVFGITIALVIATLLLAYFTYRLHTDTRNLAQETHDLAAETVSATKLADIHQQESLMPFVVVQQVGQAGYGRLNYRTTNQGKGPAIAVKATVTVVTDDGTKKTLGAVNLDSLGAEESSPNYQTNYGVPNAVVNLLEFNIEWQNIYSEWGSTSFSVLPTGDGLKMVSFTLPQIAERKGKSRD